MNISINIQKIANGFLVGEQQSIIGSGDKRTYYRCMDDIVADLPAIIATAESHWNEMQEFYGGNAKLQAMNSQVAERQRF